MPQGPDDAFVELVKNALHSGLADRLLLSGDVLGYDASLPNGGEVEAYTYLCETFLPKLVAAGVDEVTVRRLTVDNPFDAFAR
jgi:phosphotriesterase-related protein